MLARLWIVSRPYKVSSCTHLPKPNLRDLTTMPAYLNQKDAQQLDADLMSDEGGFKLEQVGMPAFSQWRYSLILHASAHGASGFVLRSSIGRRLSRQRESEARPSMLWTW